MAMSTKPAVAALLMGILASLAWGSSTCAAEPGDEPAPKNLPAAADPQAEMAGILVRGRIELDEAEVAGLPPGSQAHALTLQDAYKLALLRTTAGVSTIRDTKDLQARLQKPLPEFAQFRRVFLEVPPAAAGDKVFRDPAPGFLKLLVQLQVIENQQISQASLERLANVFGELVKSEASGVTSDELERLDLSLQRAKLQQQEHKVHYRGALDEFKLQLGLPLDLPVVLDRTTLAAFRDAGYAIHQWSADPQRSRAGLDKILQKLSALDDITIARRPLLATLKTQPNQLESLLVAAAQTAAQNRPGSVGTPHAARLDDRSALPLRNQVRQLLLIAERYQTEQKALAVEKWAYDDAEERLLSPPSASHEPNGQPASKAAQQTLKLLAADQAVAAEEDAIAETWTQYTLGRLALYRTLGSLPENDWPAYFKSLTASASKGTPNAKK